MKKIIFSIALLSLTGCNYVTQVWNPPPTPGQGYGTWTHDDTDNGCNEWNSEPAAEVDNDGNLCQSFVP